MASSGKKRKQAAIDKKANRPAGAPPAARDGDRRRRPPGPLVREVLARKRALGEWTIDDGPPIDFLPGDPD